jgi:hypothetical protein
MLTHRTRLMAFFSLWMLTGLHRTCLSGASDVAPYAHRLMPLMHRRVRRYTSVVSDATGLPVCIDDVYTGRSSSVRCVLFSPIHFQFSFFVKGFDSEAILGKFVAT